MHHSTSNTNIVSPPTPQHIDSAVNLAALEPLFPILTPSDLESDDTGSETSFSIPLFASKVITRSTGRVWLKPRPEGFTFSILRWPLLFLVSIIILVELFAYVCVRQFVMIYERFFVWTGKRRRLLNALINAITYKGWVQAGFALDVHFGRVAWRQMEKSGDYDYRLIRAIHRKLRIFTSGPVSKQHQIDDAPNNLQLIHDLPNLSSLCLESACKPNIGGIMNQRLYSSCYVGTKLLIEDYINETCHSLVALAAAPINPLDFRHTWESMDAKRHFFNRAAQLYGRTALCLSGGASFAYHHLGVIKCLWDHDLLPTIISGTSAGSLIAAIISTRTDNELHEVFDPSVHQYLTACDDSWLVRIYRLFTEGVIFSKDKWEDKMSWATCGPLTFLEAYQKTGRVLNISVVSAGAAGRRAHQRCLNYKTAPHILVSSAVLASSAIPGVVAPVQLKIKRTDRNGNSFIEPFNGWGETFQDGSLKSDIPDRILHQLWNVNFTIVSQVNPHISIFFFQAQGGTGSPVAHRGGRGWRGGFVASSLEHFLKLELQKWLRVTRDLSLLPPFLNQDWGDVWLQKFHGDVNILPHINMLDFLHILEDPTWDRMKSYLERGQASVFPKLCMIKNRLVIERKINSVIQQLK